MSLTQKILSRFGLQKIQSQKRGFEAATINRLTNDWIHSANSADEEMRGDLKVMIYRARQMERDDDYTRGFLGQLENNIIGEYGIGIQGKVLNPDRSFDTMANDKIEAGWNSWARDCGANGESLVAIDELALRRAAVDGGVLVRLWVVGGDLKLQPIEIDQLDLDYSANLSTGVFVVMGVEYGPEGVRAYHIFKNHPGDTLRQNRNGARERIPANEIIHVCKRERVGQTHGFPWFVSAMRRMRNIKGYEEAEIIAARVSAVKGGAIESPVPNTGYDGSRPENATEDLEPGGTMLLAPGQKYVSVDPTHPNDVFPQFIKAQLRGAAAGMEVAYTSLANDLESVNYSSQRGGLLVERDSYKKRQRWFIETFRQKVFDAWLPLAILNGSVNLPMSKLEKFSSVEWKPRRWPWIDPAKDMAADVMAVEKGFKSRREIISDSGGDIEDVFKSQELDNKLAEKLGLNFPIGTNPQPPNDPAAAV